VIASVALVYRVPLLTSDVDFVKIQSIAPDLDLRSYEGWPPGGEAR
jgi:hypothetical protein